MKRCSKCRQKKARAAFHSRSSNLNQLQSWCKECVLRLNRKKYANNPEPQKAAHKKLYSLKKAEIACRHREWNSKNPTSIRKYRHEQKLKRRRERKAYPERFKDNYLKKTYGITLEQFDEMMLNQGGICLICDKESRLCVDHCHKTGKVRGLLCVACNQAIGLLKDSPSSARSAAAYLERAH